MPGRIGVDLIHVSRLRWEPHSGLGELVEQTPGYHIDADGFVYSDAYSAQHIAKLRKQIDRRFHSPLHVAGVIMKLTAEHTLAHNGQGGVDDSHLPDADHRHAGAPEGEQGDGQAGELTGTARLSRLG